MKTLLGTSLLVLLIISTAKSIHAQTTGPTLLTEPNSQKAAALDAVLFGRDPLPVVARYSFSNDRRTRVALFGINLELLPEENAAAVTAKARDSQSRIYNLKVDSVRKVPALDWLTQVNVKFPDELAQAGDVWLSVTLRGQTSNEVLFNVEVQSAPRLATLVVRRITNGHDTYVDAAYSFEHGTNGAAAVRLTFNDWDVLFGNTPDRDTFSVTMVGDDRSRIQDLGPKSWSDTFQVPILVPHSEFAFEPEVAAVLGHMYVVHTKDTETDLYTLFRVEAIDPGRNVTISWKSVRSPEGN